MIHLLYLLRLYRNEYALSRYISFIQSRTTTKRKGVHRHHILPKAADFFPEFRDFTIHKWNLVYLTAREHHLAHRMLHRAFPGSSQTFAFYNMSNEQKNMSSRDYASARDAHIERLRISNQCPERCKKISKALAGKPKTEAHKRAMMGHVVTDETKEKLRIKNTGKKMTKESCAKMSASRKGKSRGSHTSTGKENIAKSRMTSQIKTPLGTFDSFVDFHKVTNIEIKIIKNIFRDLEKIPREKSLKVFGLSTKHKSWKDLGFDRTHI